MYGLCGGLYSLFPTEKQEVFVSGLVLGLWLKAQRFGNKGLLSPNLNTNESK